MWWWFSNFQCNIRRIELLAYYPWKLITKCNYINKREEECRERENKCKRSFIHLNCLASIVLLFFFYLFLFAWVNILHFSYGQINNLHCRFYMESMVVPLLGIRMLLLMYSYIYIKCVAKKFNNVKSKSADVYNRIRMQLFNKLTFTFYAIYLNL